MSDILWSEPFDLPALTKKTEAVRGYPTDIGDVSFRAAAFGSASTPESEESSELVKQLAEQVAALSSRLKLVEAEVTELRRKPAEPAVVSVAEVEILTHYRQLAHAGVDLEPAEEPLRVEAEASEDE